MCFVKCIILLNYYPLEKCADRLRGMVVAEKDAGTAIQNAQNVLNNKIRAFLDEFENQGVWEVLFAVRGITPHETNFCVGSCKFSMMDDQQFLLWGRRYFSGVYSPSEDTPISNDWNSHESPLRGQVVATVRVHAADSDHALTKGRNRIEEAINLLRYGQLVMSIPHHPFPEVGVGFRQWQHAHSFAMRIDSPDFTTKQELGGPEGNDHSISSKAPGWNGWNSLIQSDISSRTDLGIRLSIALQWIGQAALASAASIRLVALVTALEATLIEEGESMGKKAKLSGRISKLLGRTEEERQQIESQVANLYGIRSDCVHTGLIDVEKNELDKAVQLTAEIFNTILCLPPYSTMSSLSDVVDHLERITPGVDRKKWISENAYHRYRDEMDNPVKDRSLQHWLDAEREYNSQRARRFGETDPTA